MDLTQYLSEGYFDEKGNPRKELYLDWAEGIATILAREGMTKGALRRFYAQIKGIQPLMNDKQGFEKNKHRLYSIVPLANYGVNRNDSALPEEFKTFIEKNMMLAEKDEKHFKFFVEHFQSVIAYFKEK